MTVETHDVDVGPLSVSVVTGDPGFEVRVAAFPDALQVTPQSWTGNDGAAGPEDVAEAIAGRGDLAVCVAPDVPLSFALDVGRALDRRHPEIGVVLWREPTEELWRDAARTGIRDIVEPNGVDTELYCALVGAAERGALLRTERRTEAPSAPRGRVIVVLSPKGGSGKTMLTTNLASVLAAELGGQTALVDLDCMFGDVASTLGIVPDNTIGDLAVAPDFDRTALKVYLSRHERTGLFVLAGPARPDEGEAVTDDVASRAVTLLADDFPYVVVDTAAGLDERALAALDVATDVVLLSSMDVTSVRNLGKEIEALDRLGLSGARRHFVLNRADAQVGLEISDVESALGSKVSARIPSSRIVPLSMNLGRSIVLDEPRSPIAQELVRFANGFIDVEAGSRTSARSPRRSFWRR